MNKFTKNKKGYAILELLFYISFFILVSLVVINAMIVMSQSFKEVTVLSEQLKSGAIMERISREIKQALSINLISSNSLKLNTKDDLDNDKTIEFSFSGTNIEFRENDVLVGNLNTANIIISQLSFTEITTATGKAVKVFLAAKSKNDKYDRQINFYNTIALRGSY